MDDFKDRVSVSDYNRTLLHPTVHAAVRHMARKGVDFESAKLIRQLARIQHFPSISVGDLISASRASGVSLAGAYASVSEIDDIPLPFLAFLKCGSAPDAPLELVQVEALRKRRIVVWSDQFGETSILRTHMLHRWSGIVLIVDHVDQHSQPAELAAFRNDVSLLPNFITQRECAELIGYCEETSFRRSRVAQRRNEVVSEVVQARFRNSTSALLTDRTHPILSQLYDRCAELENVRPDDIEDIQGVRYKRGQKFKPHFDGGVELPRLTTFLLYLNDNFVGGETYFPVLDHVVLPVAGTCLRFPSCDRVGRILWQSEHGGLPVREGIKYALNIWVRCPPWQFQPVLDAQIPPSRANSASNRALDAPPCS